MATIGNPEWLAPKNTFEYPNQGIEVVVVLKLVRAAQGIHALRLLCNAGLFVDMGAIYRCVGDCMAEVYFLLEKYPEQSSHVQKFLNEFFARTIDGHLSSDENPVQSQKVHSAMIRSLTGLEQDEKTRTNLVTLYKTFSGYVHASYAHIMQMYGGALSSQTFNISGIPSQQQKEAHMELVEEAYKSLLWTLAHAADTFGVKDIHREIIENC